MLEIYLNFPSQVASHMNFHLKSGINGGQLSWFAGGLVGQFASHFTGLGAVVNVLAFIAEFEGRHVFSAVDALGEDGWSVFADQNFMLFEDSRGKISVVVEDGLQILDKGFISFVQFKMGAHDSSLNKSPNSIFVVNGG